MGPLLALCVACSIGLYAVDAAAQSRGDHDTFHSWYRGLRSPEGEGCCNERDCHPVAARYTPEGPEGALVLEILIRSRWVKVPKGRISHYHPPMAACMPVTATPHPL